MAGAVDSSFEAADDDGALFLTGVAVPAGCGGDVTDFVDDDVGLSAALGAGTGEVTVLLLLLFAADAVDRAEVGAGAGAGAAVTGAAAIFFVFSVGTIGVGFDSTSGASRSRSSAVAVATAGESLSFVVGALFDVLDLDVVAEGGFDEVGGAIPDKSNGRLKRFSLAPAPTPAPEARFDDEEEAAVVDGTRAAVATVGGALESASFVDGVVWTSSRFFFLMLFSSAICSFSFSCVHAFLTCPVIVAVPSVIACSLVVVPVALNCEDALRWCCLTAIGAIVWVACNSVTSATDIFNCGKTFGKRSVNSFVLRDRPNSRRRREVYAKTA